jgi:hypothetical protein
MRGLEVFNAFCKIFWGNIIIVFGMTMCFITKDPVWLWAVVIGGIFFGIKALAGLAQNYAASISQMGGAREEISYPSSICKKPSNEEVGPAMGGFIEDVAKKKLGLLWLSTKTIIVVIAVALVGSYVGYLQYQLHREQTKVELLSPTKQIPKNASHVIKVTKKGLNITDTQGKVTTIKKVRGRDQSFTVDKSGEIKYDRVSNYMPFLTVIPHVDLVVTPKSPDMALGLQVVRSEELGIGLNALVGAQSLGVSASKDILDNSLAGVSYTWDNEGVGRVGLSFGVYF